ncbi:CRISPR-associated RAMP Crm2 family protein [Gloeomargarita lithophora Alchichica-D10]|uniref:CRISPR-associated RAMP Crm2 family protein n=1 Tax=Gloeomargarita lithophora Alchichica-D10 TaxID=1188229 RepID=A0A1J0AAG9_9CYAN|nr:type III-B CRISPR-associated protein Cas10/Cmr2 [Gloeomargarita lithophora]APB32932.1 CRISPR-associated RAMP Crm2 family protein [Gloeomargarita lithophora Alchichica-D10]
MSQHHYWQAKIWGLLHDPALKALHDGSGRSGEGVWPQLNVMQNWVSPKSSHASDYQKYIGDADLIASASDRSAIGHLSTAIDYQTIDRGLTLGTGLEIAHLLSAEKIFWQLQPDEHRDLHLASNRAEHLRQREESVIPAEIKNETDPQKVFWWFWRCFPDAICRKFNDDSLMLMPAETRLPDGSIWSHASITSALAGCLAGYGSPQKTRPYLASFTFSPIQELIKASRKMRDFWAGSWVLHYLSAKICWKLAVKYGADCLLYPSLYAQPLIDYWLLEKYSDFAAWINKPSAQKLLTAGFPNVIMVLLPEDKVQAAMQMAQQTLQEEWQTLADSVFDFLKTERHWMPQLSEADLTWQGWLDHQWQHYWAAVPLGSPNQKLKDTGILHSKDVIDNDPWVKQQNKTYHLTDKQRLFLEKELAFLRESFLDKNGNHRQYKPGVNIGSWWAAVVDETRRVQAACKNARDWELPVAFGSRSTISGIGSVVHPSQSNQWITEGESQGIWQRNSGLFDGREQLNATETVKRGLHKILPSLFPGLDQDKIEASYPDLTAGVAGYLKVHSQDQKHKRNFEAVCQKIKEKYPWVNNVIHQMRGKWGIPWADVQVQRYHPRLLNAGWLVEDADVDEETKKEDQQDINQILSEYYSGANPANWYVLAAGDGDSMSEWLKGTKMKGYYDYLPTPLKNLADGHKQQIGYVFKPQELEEVKDSFSEFVKDQELKKRMGPSTHNALSRALLDFSNQLVPYLTEQRYAGRLIYGGGDDVLAYTNLWEWDQWLWDIRQCFRGQDDPGKEFNHQGNYWQWEGEDLPKGLSQRPLFTMGSDATISFGIVIAHQSVPLAIALENLWKAEKEAKQHEYDHANKKDAVQVQVLYANGNILKATSKFDTFQHWKSLLGLPDLEPAVLEQAAQLWEQHPAPISEAIPVWVQLFCDRRDVFKKDGESKQNFQSNLVNFLQHLWKYTPNKDRDMQIQNWLKLAAFNLRNRHIKLKEQ